MTITWQHMSITFLFVLALHAGIAMWLTWSTPEPQAKPIEQMLRVSLLATVAETITAPAPKPAAPQPIAKPASSPSPKAIPKPPAEHIAKPAPLPKPIPKPTPVPTPEAVVQPLSEPHTTEEPTPKPATTEPPPEQPQSAESTAMPLNAAATAKYEQLLVAWLEKHKKYPRRAKRMRIEGEGRLRILIDRTGQTQAVTLEQNTGNRILDKAVLEMAKKANPFPPMPENDPRKELEFIVPVVFALR